jgi:uncharacterized membrane protein YeaQ/YmgE (transglycosylase-associated protein family)
MVEFIAFVLVGLVAGWLAGMIVKGGGYGVVGDIVVGLIGSLVGGFLFHTFGVSLEGGLPASLIVATVGAVALILLLRVLRRV